MPDIPNVETATDLLLSVLSKGQFEYALIGGLAVVLHGFDRYTQDVDALVWDLDILKNLRANALKWRASFVG